MFDVSRFQLRMACVVTAILFLAAGFSAWAESQGYLGSIAHDAGTWRYQGVWIPIWLLSLLGFLQFAVLVSGLIGTFMFKNWGRLLLATALVLAFAMEPLRGEVVYGPLTLFLASALTLLHVWTVVVAYWSPQGHAFFVKTEGFAA